MTIARARALDGIALPKVIERCQRFLPIFTVHGVPAQELPAFIREKPEAGLSVREKFCQPFKGWFGHGSVSGRRGFRFYPERFQIGFSGSSLLEVMRFQFGGASAA